MPTYEYYCNECDLVFDNTTSLSGWSKLGVCPFCGNTKATQFFGTPPNVQKPLQAYFDHGLNKQINSWDDRKRVIKEKGYEEIGDDRSYMDEQRELKEQCRDKKNLKT